VTQPGLLSFFQRRFARLSGAWGPLARRAFLIYIIHPPILVSVALAWRAIAAPALVKFLITGSIPKLVRAAVEGRLPRGINIERLRDAPMDSAV
jgi:hypothetical protein